jgi:hypothetical protein
MGDRRRRIHGYPAPPLLQSRLVAACPPHHAMGPPMLPPARALPLLPWRNVELHQRAYRAHARSMRALYALYARGIRAHIERIWHAYRARIERVYSDTLYTRSIRALYALYARAYSTRIERV